MNQQRKNIRVLHGRHAGAQVEIDSGSSFSVGSDPACDIVLSDAGVAPKHLLLSMDEYGSTCRALAAEVVIVDCPLSPGRASSVDDFQTIHCGSAVLGVSDIDADPAGWDNWRAARQRSSAEMSAPLGLNTLRRVNPYALFVSVIVGIAGVIGLAYAALSHRDNALTPETSTARQEWLRGVAPARSELQLVRESSGQMLVTGYVASNAQRDALLDAVAHSSFNPRVEVYAADQMATSLLRLAQLQGLPCVAQYVGAGRMACSNELPNEAAATKLKLIGKEVPGLVSLEARVMPQSDKRGAPHESASIGSAPQVAQAPAPVAPTAQGDKQGPAKINTKFSVFMFRNGRFLVDTAGQRYTEGEEFDGYTIGRIGVDEVTFKRDGREYAFQVGAFGAAR